MPPDIAAPRIAAHAPVAAMEAPVAAAAAIAEHVPVDVQAAGIAPGNPDFPSHMKSRVFRDKHRLLKKRITARALEVWPDDPVHGPPRTIPMAFSVERILWTL